MISRLTNLAAVTLIMLLLSACGPSQYEKTKALAEAGDAEAQFALSELYKEQGESDERMKWLSAASNQGFTEAQCTMATLSISPDILEAVRLYGLVADKQEPDSDICRIPFLYEPQLGNAEVVTAEDSMGSREWSRLLSDERMAIRAEREEYRLRAARHFICAVLYSAIGSQQTAELFAKSGGYYAEEGGADPRSTWNATSARAQEVFIEQVTTGVENRDSSYFEKHHTACIQLAEGDPAMEALAAQAGG